METFSALLAISAGNSPVTGEFPAQRPVTQSFDVSLICAWINGWVNNREAGDLRRYGAHYDVIVMTCSLSFMVIVLTQSKAQVKQFAPKKCTYMECQRGENPIIIELHDYVWSSIIRILERHIYE